jgi:NAD(P)-dependent dehydrogenase (short-subunit alcohol dehydrogenase family)
VKNVTDGPPPKSGQAREAFDPEEFIMRFEEKHLVIIGGSSGIGLEAARMGLAEGASVTIAGRSEARLLRAAEALNTSRAGGPIVGRLKTVVADAADEASIRALFDKEPRVDHLFLPAGELRPGGGDPLGGDLDGLRSILDVRLLGVARAVRQARPRMTGGSITLMSGLYSTRPARGGAMAAAAVAAVEGMTRALALDLAPTRVNAVAPGLIDTPWTADWDLVREVVEQVTPLKRVGQPEDVAEVVLALARSAYVTGQILGVDGGLSIAN